jgi:hypothetical protein
MDYPLTGQNISYVACLLTNRNVPMQVRFDLYM